MNLEGQIASFLGYSDMLRQDTLTACVRAMKATPADMPGLWNVEGYPELTTNQLMQIAMTNAWPHA